jgi:hypothetical protein
MPYEEIVADDGNESQTAQATHAAHRGRCPWRPRAIMHNCPRCLRTDSQLRQHELALKRRRRDTRETVAIV